MRARRSTRWTRPSKGTTVALMPVCTPTKSLLLLKSVSPAGGNALMVNCLVCSPITFTVPPVVMLLVHVVAESDEKWSVNVTSPVPVLFSAATVAVRETVCTVDLPNAPGRFTPMGGRQAVLTGGSGGEEERTVSGNPPLMKHNTTPPHSTRPSPHALATPPAPAP